MSDLMHRFGVLCGAILALSIGSGSAAAGEQPGPRNPFAAIAVPQEPELAPAPAPVPAAAPELRLETVVLKFLDARSLKDVVDKMVSPYGMVAVNEKNNSIIVCDAADNLRRILAEIKKADQTPRQIMVEVVILDVQLRDDMEIGVNWDLLSTDLYDVVYRQSLTSSRVFAVPPTPETIGNATAYNSLGLGGDFGVVSGTIRHVLHLIQQKRQVRILASPRALVVSGETAAIKAVEEIPYEEIIDTAQGGAAALTSTEFKEVGVSLRVEAIVTDGNNIFLTVDTEQNVRTGESERGVPVVDTRHANTSLLLQDGQTVILGGLRREETTKAVNQIPILGDLPVIGLLFKSTRTVTTRSELVVLLSPHLCQAGQVPENILAESDRIRAMSLIPARVEASGEPGEPQEQRPTSGR